MEAMFFIAGTLLVGGGLVVWMLGTPLSSNSREHAHMETRNLIVRVFRSNRL